MTMASGNFSKLVTPGFRKVFFTDLKARSTEYDKALQILTSERQFEEEFKMAGVEQMQAKAEGTSITYSDPVQGGTKRYTHTTMGRGFRITEEMIEDDLYKVTGEKMSASLARAVANRCEVDGWSVFNNAFSTSYVGFTASESLCATSHTLLGGGTLANRPTTETDLSATSLQAAVESFEGFTDDRGFPVLSIPKLVIVGPTQKWAAREILNSEYRPYSSDNEINSLRDEEMKYFVCHYLTDPDSWFVVAALSDKTIYDGKFFWRRKPRYDSSDDFETGDVKNKVTFRSSYGYSDFRWIYGSQGG